MDDVPCVSRSLLITVSFSASSMWILDSFLLLSLERSSNWAWRSRNFLIIRSASSVTLGGITAKPNHTYTHICAIKLFMILCTMQWQTYKCILNVFTYFYALAFWYTTWPFYQKKVCKSLFACQSMCKEVYSWIHVCREWFVLLPEAFLDCSRLYWNKKLRIFEKFQPPSVPLQNLKELGQSTHSRSGTLTYSKLSKHLHSTFSSIFF